ncbi:hypothetical protein GCM10018793_39330 [Streptomyces sulfonofaciens]|uniref:THIF-type NAD/FAD binding fold domain-containing protein n=1 Tax=Streptomyces sulfonofaciens TaxID=68272 RepID=A0A919L3R4_9ACTN|nr:ThiF family adenylyltransferase [Streptomyces sulfonofaciens]GHH81596.1 hypothetical protein GCM10018793_39330 [Streptomyces sulfonofaciens]
MHPVLKPALRRGWRSLHTVQFGVAPAHAVVLGPVDGATDRFLALLDGTRGLPLLRAEGRRTGLPEGRVDALIAQLTRAGLLDDSTGGGPAAEALRARSAVLDRLRPDLATLSVTDPAPGGALRALAARQAMRVQVRGAGRVGVTLAALLSAAGVGHVDVRDGGRVEPWDVAPGGLPPESIGERRADAARRAVRRAAPDRHARPPAGGGRAGSAGAGAPDVSLVILAPRDGLDAHAPDPAASADLVAAGVPHLYAGVMEATGMVGPLVLPGMTGCAGCLAQRRTDRDPTWPRLVAQWRSGRQRRVIAGDTALASSTASLAAAHALAFLDGGLPASAGARCEVSAPGLDWRCTPLPSHPRCPCGAHGKAADQQDPVPAAEAGPAADRRGPAREGRTARTTVHGRRHETMSR